MSKVTHAEFAKSVNMGNGNLTNYLKRGKIVRDENGFYDLSHPDNADFIENRNRKMFKDVRADSSVSESGTAMGGIEKTIKILDANKKKREISLLDLKIEKLNATVIPTELVKLVFAQQFKSSAIAFKDGAEKLLARVSKELGLNNSQIGLIRKELVVIINESIEDSINESRKQIGSIVGQFQESRGIGERK